MASSNVVDNVVGRVSGVAIVGSAAVAGTGVAVVGAGVVVTGVGAVVLPAIGTGIATGVGLFSGTAGAATATAFASAGTAVAGAGAAVAGVGAAVTAAISTAYLAIASVAWLPPVAIGIAAALTLPAIAGGFYEAGLRWWEYAKQGSNAFLPIRAVLATVALPFNFVSGFLRTGVNLLTGKGYTESFKETRHQVNSDIARERGEKWSVLGPLVPKTVDRFLVAPVVGLASGLMGGLVTGFNVYLPVTKLKVVGTLTGILPLYTAAQILFGPLRGIYRGLVGGSSAALDTYGYLSKNYQERRAGSDVPLDTLRADTQLGLLADSQNKYSVASLEGDIAVKQYEEQQLREKTNAIYRGLSIPLDAKPAEQRQQMQQIQARTDLSSSQRAMVTKGALLEVETAGIHEEREQLEVKKTKLPRSLKMRG